MANENARNLRTRSTDAEKRLWSKLRRHQLNEVQFSRQFPIGSYIVDFCAPRQKLIIELDGGHHALQVEKDQERTVWLESQGYCVLRFWNRDVLHNTEGVVEAIRDAIL